MLFNSYEFIFIFLPIVFLVYVLLNVLNFRVFIKYWLILSSLFFYSWWNISYLPLLLVSIVINFGIGKVLRLVKSNRSIILTLGILFNIVLLGYFKYAGFLVFNINLIFNKNYQQLDIILPLAISFFTFQQIAYLVDAFRVETKKYSFSSYILFVTFFPQLIAGPIVNHKEMIPQLKNIKNNDIDYKNISVGLFLFIIGLFKKVVIADSFASWAKYGFDIAEKLSFLEAWIVSLSYTFQLYFDFSGYSDMAIGLALLFNVKLPTNFYSPYKAKNIQDFWRRWHITLSRFLRVYIYIPLGGNRNGKTRTFINILITFLIAGLWHGAGWTFIIWGGLHGIALVIHRIWNIFNYRLNPIISWLLTFNFVNASWVFFRANDITTALDILKTMLGFNLFLDLDIKIEGVWQSLLFIAIATIIVLVPKNSMQFTVSSKLSVINAVIIGILATCAIVNLGDVSEFLYFDF